MVCICQFTSLEKTAKDSVKRVLKMIGHFSQIVTKLADIAKNKKNGNPPGLSYILTKILENRCYQKAFENIIL